MKPKIVFFGNTRYSIIGGRIIHQKYTLSLVVTIPDREMGRKRELTFSPTKKFALEENIPILEADKLNKEIIQKIARMQPDFLIVEDYGLILPKELLDLAKIAAINIHHSLLPKYRGPSPAPTAILNGDKVSGVTIIKMAKEVDSGDILAQREYELAKDETTDSLLKKLNQLGGELVINEVIPKYLDHTIQLRVQNHARAVFCTQITKQDGYFDLENPPDPEILDRMIRAFYPWPGVWTRWSPSAKATGDKNAKIVKFLPSSSHHSEQSEESKYLIQMEGKKVVSLKDFLNGYPNFPLKNF